MSETYEKINGDLAVTVRVTEQTLLDELARQAKKRDRAQAAMDVLDDKIAVINAVAT